MHSLQYDLLTHADAQAGANGQFGNTLQRRLALAGKAAGSAAGFAQRFSANAAASAHE